MCIINIISLNRRPDRKLMLIKHLDQMGCLYRFWEGYDDRSIMPFENISASHKSIVRDAKNMNLECVLIGEDDLRFSSKDSLNFFFQNTPDSFDLFFGMIYTGTIQDRRIVHGFSGLQFYLVHKKFYDTFLSAPPKKHLDVWLGQSCHLYEYYVCDPFICGAISSYSDNFKKQWVFDENKLPRKLLKDDIQII